MKRTKRNTTMIHNLEMVTHTGNAGYENRGKTGKICNQKDIKNMEHIISDKISNIQQERHYVKRIINWLENKDQRLTKAGNILFEISKLTKQSIRCNGSDEGKSVIQNNINKLIYEFDSFVKRYISAEEAMGKIFDENIESMISCDALEKLNNENLSVRLTDENNSLGEKVNELSLTMKMVRRNQFEIESYIDLLYDEYEKSYVKETNLLASFSSINGSEKFEDEIEMILCGGNF